jgi:hypothetical protein
MKIKMALQIFVKFSNMKLNQNRFLCFRIVSIVQRNGEMGPQTGVGSD